MSVRVVARIRPLLNNELDKDTIVKADAPGKDVGNFPTIIRIPSPKNDNEHFSFQFSRVYETGSTQQELFESEVSPTVKHLFNGFDVTLFAYGVTGTGKTHTMRGGKSLADRGIIPRLLSAIYRRCRKVEKDSDGHNHVQVLMSYYEIYNDKVFDLFEAPEKRTPAGLPLRDNGGKTVVVGLTERPCESLKEFEKLYDHANVNRSTSATKLNAHSSRSHAILCVKLVTTINDQVRMSAVSAIDLAGSEDNRRTDNNKERLVESASINRSLFVLAQCVEAISKKQNRIPYRESKMTRVLALGQNNGLTVMFLNLAPVRSYHLDTISSLNFANRTKKIEIRDIENEPVAKGYTKPSAVVAGPSMQRQPLRPLAGVSINVPARTLDRSAKLSAKRARTFAVFADKSNPGHENARPILPKRSSPLKRPSDPYSSHNPRRPKVLRTNESSVSKAAIEGMVERKVAEILASRTADPVPLPSSGMDDEVKKRLEALEQRIENQGEGKSEGLTFLLMAKQHQAHGEDSSALKMFELAQEYFPDNEKLASKIAKLQQKIYGRRAETQRESGELSIPTHTQLNSLHSSRTAQGGQSSRPERGDSHDENDDYVPEDDGHDSDEEFRSRAKPRRQRAAQTTPNETQAGNEDPAISTPRTRQLLRIINSRDTDQIRLLRGVGAKKAEAIVAALCAGVNDGQGNDQGNDDGGVAVGSLRQLGMLRGVGAKTVENMRGGLVGVL